MKKNLMSIAKTTLLFLGFYSSYITVSANETYKANLAKSDLIWLATKIGGEHNGGIKLKSGEFTIENSKIKSGTFIIDMTTISCIDLKDEKTNKMLVDHLKSDDFFSVHKFSTAKIVLTESSPFVNGKATVTGKLTIKGITEPITFVVIKTENIYTAEIVIDRTKYNIRYGSGSFFKGLGDKMIDDNFTLRVNIVGDK